MMLLRLLSSLKTTLALILFLVILSICGSAQIHFDPSSYNTIEQGVLFEWLLPRGLTGSTWWVWGMIVLSGLLVLNTTVCAALRLAKYFRSRRMPVRAFFAHLGHLGFLLVMAAHLLGSAAGFRAGERPVFRGQSFKLDQRPDWEFKLGETAIEFAPEGYPKSLSAEVSVERGEGEVSSALLGINRPMILDGVAVYVNNVQQGLRGCDIVVDGGKTVVAEIGSPVELPGGTLTFIQWTQTRQRELMLRFLWTSDSGAKRQQWVQYRPGGILDVNLGANFRWGDIVVDNSAMIDVRYDPGAKLALIGSVMLGLSLLPLLWPRRRGAV